MLILHLNMLELEISLYSPSQYKVPLLHNMSEGHQYKTKLIFKKVDKFQGPRNSHVTMLINRSSVARAGV